MDKYSQPYLEKYSGRSSRHKCPACGDEYSLAYYLDGNTGEVIDKNVGRCNHESGCGYHYTPKQFFIDNPDKVKTDSVTTPNVKRITPVTSVKEPGYIPFKYVQQSASYDSTFVMFLCQLFDRDTLQSPTIEKIMKDYAIGATKRQDVIFWQIDIHGNVRTGKIMAYNQETGHRIKENTPGINWVHAVMKKKKQLPEDFNLKQCLFGEHLLKLYPNHPVAIVEAEKSAVIASAIYDSHIWLATGGKSQMSIDKLRILAGRNVTMFPDADGLNEWRQRAKDLENEGLFFKVSDILERNATKEEKEAKIDIADWIISQLSTINKPTQDKTQNRNILSYFESINPAFNLFVKNFNLIPIDF